MTTRLFPALVMSVLTVSTTYGGWTTFGTVNDLYSDAFASGEILTERDGTSMGSWNLSTTVSDTDFSNYALHGGASGLEYVMLNQVVNSDDVNAIQFTVIPVEPTNVAEITIMQSPYDNSTNWNGGPEETSQFFLKWSGDLGAATVHDPNNQLVQDHGQSLTTDSLITFSSNEAVNTVDSWSISLPRGADSVEVHWSSSNPSDQSKLTREWVTFEADFAPAVVPEPSAFALVGLAGMMLFAFRRSTKASRV